MGARESLDDFARIRLNRARSIGRDPGRSGGGEPAFVGRVLSTLSEIAVGRFLLVQPTAVLGAEVEGGSGTFEAIRGGPVPVYLIGPGKPSTGDLLVCRHVDYRWVAERRGNVVGGFALCSPCNIPTTTLTLSWYYWRVRYGGSSGTTYNSAGPISTPLSYVIPSNLRDPTRTWSSGWFPGPLDSSTCSLNPGNPALINDCCYLNFTLTCNQALGTNLKISLSSTPDGSPGKAYCSDGTQSAKVGAASFNCSPFMIRYDGTGNVANLFVQGVVTP